MAASTLYTVREGNLVEFINDRLEGWRIILQAHIKGFQELVRIEEQCKGAYQSMASSYSFFKSEEKDNGDKSHSRSASSSRNGSVQEQEEQRVAEEDEEDLSSIESTTGWTARLQSEIERVSHQQRSFIQFLSEQALPQLHRLLQDDVQRGRGKAIRIAISEAQAKLVKTHELLLQAIAAHQRGWELHGSFRGVTAPGGVRHQQQQQQQQQQRDGGQTEEQREKCLNELIEFPDIFLTERQLKVRVDRFVGEKERFLAVLSSEFDQLCALDRFLSLEFRMIVTQFLSAHQQHHPQHHHPMAEFTDICREDHSIEWRSGLHQHHLDDGEGELLLNPPPSADQLLTSLLRHIGNSLASSLGLAAAAPAMTTTVSVRSINVLKSGYLMRPPSSPFSRTWSVYYFILVDSGFLHGYSVDDLFKRASSATSSASLSTVAAASHLKIPTASLQLHGKGLADVNAMAAQYLMGSASAADVWGTVSPVVSVPLMHPATLVMPEVARSAGTPRATAATTGEKFVFSITVPGSSSFFGRSEKKYLLRSFVEEDLVDWCIALKEVMSNLTLSLDRSMEGAIANVSATAASFTTDHDTIDGDAHYRYEGNRTSDAGGAHTSSEVEMPSGEAPTTVATAALPHSMSSPIAEENDNPWG